MSLRCRFSDGKAEQFYRSSPEAANQVTGFLARIANAVRRWYNKAVRATSYEAQQTARLGVETVERAHQLWIDGIRAASENLRNMNISDKVTKLQGTEQTKKITLGMTDSERYDILICSC